MGMKWLISLNCLRMLPGHRLGVQIWVCKTLFQLFILLSFICLFYCLNDWSHNVRGMFLYAWHIYNGTAAFLWPLHCEFGGMEGQQGQHIAFPELYIWSYLFFNKWGHLTWRDHVTKLDLFRWLISSYICFWNQTNTDICGRLYQLDYNLVLVKWRKSPVLQ